METVKAGFIEMAVLSSLSFMGLCFLLFIYKLFDFGSISPEITSTINYVFNILFSSLNILAFFIRPNTIKIVCLCFSTYWLIRLTLRTLIVTIKLGRGLKNFLSGFVGVTSSFIIKAFGM